MTFIDPDAQRMHILQGEQNVKGWKAWEAVQHAELSAAEAAFSRNPRDPTLKKQCEDAATKAENVRVAREQREKSVEAAKRCFGWIS